MNLTPQIRQRYLFGPVAWVICMGKKIPPSFRRTYVHFGGLFSGGLVSWKDGKWSPYVLSPLDAVSPRNYEAESPDEFALVKAAANAGWEFKSRCLDESTVVFFVGVFFCMFFEWFLVGCRGHSPEVRCKSANLTRNQKSQMCGFRAWRSLQNSYLLL